MKRPNKKLLREWYGKLRSSGFRDIENGVDLNRYHASTFGRRVVLVGRNVK